MMSEERRQTSSEEAARLVLGAESLAKIREHLQLSYPEEACGGLLGRIAYDNVVVVEETVSLANARVAERRRRYLIGPTDVLELERRAEASGLQVVGYYHSHPDAPPVPSEFDRKHAWPWYAYLIASVESGNLTRSQAWRLSDDRERFLPLQLSEEE
jgi:proteasome lid subunit RPN8/RPN11